MGFFLTSKYYLTKNNVLSNSVQTEYATKILERMKNNM